MNKPDTELPPAAVPPALSPRFALALQMANEIHGHQARKGAGVPYISHLMAVCALVLEFGGSETEAIAALLHDAAEDCGGRAMLEAVRVLFGDDVARIVEACTDTFETPKPDWRPRKQAYLEALASKSPMAKRVACADKLHNLSHTLRDIQREGVAPWAARMAATPNGAAEKQRWYYCGCLEALRSGWNDPLLDEFARSVEELCRIVGDRTSPVAEQSLVGQ